MWIKYPYPRRLLRLGLGELPYALVQFHLLLVLCLISAKFMSHAHESGSILVTLSSTVRICILNSATFHHHMRSFSRFLRLIHMFFFFWRIRHPNRHPLFVMYGICLTDTQISFGFQHNTSLQMGTVQHYSRHGDPTIRIGRFYINLTHCSTIKGSFYSSMDIFNGEKIYRKISPVV